MQPEPKSYVIKKKYELPSMTFPYRIKTRLNMLSCPRRQFIEEPIMPALTPFGVRKAALAGPVNYKIHEAALPYLRILLSLKRNFKHKFDEQRLERVNRKIEAANATVYSKLANCVINLKSQQDPNLSSFASRKKKAWSESDWRKHTEYLLNLSKPKRVHQPELFERGEPVPLEHLLPRIEKLVRVPETKIYKRLSQDTWYRNPTKIVVAGMGVPWLGYCFGYLFARVCRQPHPDALAISIETGIQNTGIAIFLLRYALPQPEADLTTVVPVSVAIMTPIPMTCIYIVQKIMECIENRNAHKKIVEEGSVPRLSAGVATVDGGFSPQLGGRSPDAKGKPDA